MNLDAEREFNAPKRVMFVDAWVNYKKYLGDESKAPRCGRQILEHLGSMAADEIDDTMITKLIESVFPNGCSPATANRHIITPIVSCLHKALKEKAPELTRPKGYGGRKKQIEVPGPEWYRAIWNELGESPRPLANRRALVMVLATHGRRLGELLSRKPQHLDGNVLHLGVTKNGNAVSIELEPQVLDLVIAMPNWKTREWLFDVGPNSAAATRQSIRTACRKAGVRWYTPHEFGRHTSVTRMLRAGFSVAHVAMAHGMTEQMIAKNYGHLAKKETTAAMHKVGGELASRVLGWGNVGESTSTIVGGESADGVETRLITQQ